MLLRKASPQPLNWIIINSYSGNFRLNHNFFTVTSNVLYIFMITYQYIYRSFQQIYPKSQGHRLNFPDFVTLSWKGPTIECSTVCPVCQPNPAVADVVVTVIWVLDDLVIHKSCVHAAWNLPCDADVVCWIVGTKIIVLTLSMQINKLNYPGIIFLMKCMFNILYTSNHSYFTLIINTI